MESKNVSNFWPYLFNPKSIAVIGATNTPRSWGFQAVLTALNSQKIDPERKVYPVNPKAQEILGVKAYPTILDIPDPVELAIIVVRADLVPSIMKQCVEKKIKAAVVISAGFAEVGKEGAQLQAEMQEMATKAGIHFVGPNCAGHYNFQAQLGTSMDAAEAKTGPVALITQSGTLGGVIVQKAKEKNLGFSRFVSTGNESDLHFEDYMEYMGDDSDTKVITGYVEGLREGRRFFELAQKISPKKPIVLIKTGTTEKSGQAAKSHTGALAGGEAAYNAAFKQAGVIRVEDDQELCDVTTTYLNMPLPRGKRIGIVTVGGGFGVVASEACEKEGLIIPSLEQSTIDKMNKILPPQWSQSNPADLVNTVVQKDENLIPNCLRYLLQDNNIDVLIALLHSPIPIHNTGQSLSPESINKLQKEYNDYQKFLYDLAHEYGKPIIKQEMYFTKLPAIISDTLPDIGIRIPSFEDPRRAARVIRHLVTYREYLEKLKED